MLCAAIVLFHFELAFPPGQSPLIIIHAFLSVYPSLFVHSHLKVLNKQTNRKTHFDILSKCKEGSRENAILLSIHPHTSIICLYVTKCMFVWTGLALWFRYSNCNHMLGMLTQREISDLHSTRRYIYFGLRMKFAFTAQEQRGAGGSNQIAISVTSS